VKALSLFAAAVVLLAVVVLAATAFTGLGESGTRATAAPSTAFPQFTVPFDTGSAAGKGQVDVTVEPGLIGRNSVQAVILDAEGGLAAVPEVRITFTLPGKDIGPLDAGLKNKGGYWSSDSLNLPFPGAWSMAITIRTSDVDQATVRRNVTIRSSSSAS
jgi:copper transport protein